MRRNRHSRMYTNSAAGAYWGKRMYPQVVEEWKVYGAALG